MFHAKYNSCGLLLARIYPRIIMSDVASRDKLTCVRSTVVAICSAVNRRQRRLRSRLDVRFALAVSRVAVLFHNLDFRLQIEHKLFPSVSSRRAHPARVFWCLKS